MPSVIWMAAGHWMMPGRISTACTGQPGAFYGYEKNTHVTGVRAPDFLVPMLLLCALAIGGPSTAIAWSNGGYSQTPSHPDYGTHDFLAQHALDYVPDELDFWLRDNLQAYLYGTELPDNKNAPLGDGIGDTTHHHIYYHANGQLQDDAAARRAQESFQQTLTFLTSGDYQNAAKWMGVTSHYVTDVAVFGHVMGKMTDWSAEKHHADYEDWVNDHTRNYDDSFKVCLTSGGALQQISPYEAALSVAHDTTFDDSGKGHTAKWMDIHYDSNNSTFQTRTCESINLSVNAIADLVYSASVSGNLPELPQPAPVIAMVILLSMIGLRTRVQGEHDAT